MESASFLFLTVQKPRTKKKGSRVFLSHHQLQFVLLEPTPYIKRRTGVVKRGPAICIIEREAISHIDPAR